MSIVSPLELKTAGRGRDAAEITFEPNGPIALSELAGTFAALDSLYAKSGIGDERLAVAEIKSGSIVAVLVPYLPIIGQTIEVMGAANNLSDFVKKMKSSISAFAGIEKNEKILQDAQEVAPEIAEILKPLAGKANSSIKMAYVKYRSETKDRTVEIEATFGSSDIDRASINASNSVNMLPVGILGDKRSDIQQTLLRKVELSLHQANRGAPKHRGTTGDKGVIEAVFEKPLPVYFAGDVNDLKTKLVADVKNPLKVGFIVDAMLKTENGNPISYTVVEVYGPVRSHRKIKDDLFNSLTAPTAPAPKRLSKPKSSTPKSKRNSIG